MNLRKTAGLLAVAGLMVGLLGTGVGASFLDQVTGTENISVGTFACVIVEPSDGTIAGDGKSVTYTAPQISSSAAGNAPFSFSVQNTGSISQVLSVAKTGQTGNLGGKFSDMPASVAPASLAPGATALVSTGIQWTTLDNDDLGRFGSMTWTVSCDENTPAVIFDNTPSVVPGNLPSQAFQAQQTDEWGAGALFAGTNRTASTATVTMSSWTCQSGAWNTNDCLTTPGATYPLPITFKVYNVGSGDTVGSVVATKTQTFNIPYRPSADPGCTAGDAGKWKLGGTCFNGFAFNIVFTFAGETLPNNAIFGISYNTSNYGPAPLGGSNNPSDSLNVATYPGVAGPVAPAVGAWTPDNDSAYWNTHTASNYSDGGSGGTGTFRLDSGGWGGYLPAVQITATN